MSAAKKAAVACCIVWRHPTAKPPVHHSVKKKPKYEIIWHIKIFGRVCIAVMEPSASDCMTTHLQENFYFDFFEIYLIKIKIKSISKLTKKILRFAD